MLTGPGTMPSCCIIPSWSTLVPAMDQVAVRKLNNGDGRDVDFATGWEAPPPVAVVGTGHAQAYGHLVTFCYRVFDRNVQIRKGASHVAHKGLELGWTVDLRIGGGQPKAYAFRRK
jgi:hypothetical protein